MTTAISNLAHDAIQAAGEARKALVALLGAAALVTESHVLHGTAQTWVTIGTGLAAGALTYLAPNGPLMRELGKLDDVGVGMLDDDTDTELSEPVSKPDLDPAPLTSAPLALTDEPHHPLPGPGTPTA